MQKIPVSLPNVRLRDTGISVNDSGKVTRGLSPRQIESNTTRAP